MTARPIGHYCGFLTLFFILLSPSHLLAEEWVALQDPDTPDVYFSIDGYPISADRLKVQTTLRANRDVNVRAHAADWTGISRILKKGSEIIAVEFKSLPAPGNRTQIWAKISTGPATVGPISGITSSEISSEKSKYASTPDFSDKKIADACRVLQTKLQKPALRSETTILGHYTDLFTLPQTKTECISIKDTGIPDAGSCTTVWDDCGEHIDLPFGGWTCKPTSSTRCTNAKICDGYKTSKKTMECDLTFQLKLPDFIEKPVSDFIDDNMELVQSAQAQLNSALPIECASKDVQEQAKSQNPNAMAQAIGDLIKQKIQERIRKEAEDWLKETAVTTIAASIPSGGVGGGAALTTSLGKFIYRVHRAVKPIMSVANDVKGFAEDAGFGTSCGWAKDWSAL